MRREPAPNWRTALDRAWRTASVRRLFEAECGLTPLSSTDNESLKQAITGQTGVYQERFLLWATRHFGLEEQAPPDIQHKIALGA
jgi:hypothetical protein